MEFSTANSCTRSPSHSPARATLHDTPRNNNIIDVRFIVMKWDLYDTNVGDEPLRSVVVVVFVLGRK